MTIIYNVYYQEVLNAEYQWVGFTRSEDCEVSLPIEEPSLPPAIGATVRGAWSGVITKGDTSRVADADGTATFYLARTRSAGKVESCVIDITRTGSTYNPDDSRDGCDLIEK